MPYINVEVDEETVRLAREASSRAGMLLKKWVERAVLAAAEAEKPRSEPRYVPLESE